MTERTPLDPKNKGCTTALLVGGIGAPLLAIFASWSFDTWLFWTVVFFFFAGVVCLATLHGLGYDVSRQAPAPLSQDNRKPR